MPATTNVFQGIGGTLDNATTTFVTNVAGDTIATVYPWALGALTLYITLYAYMMMTGQVQEPFKTGLLKMVKVMIVGTMALNADMYLNGVVEAFRGIEEGLTSAFSGSAGGSIYASLDSSLSKGLELIMQCREKAQAASWREMGTIFMWYLIMAILAIGFALVVVFGGIAILMSTIYLKILFAIGPVFIMCLMFPVTAKFFDSWVGFVLNHVLIVALTAVVLTLGVTIYDNEIAKVVIDSDQNMLMVALELLVVAAILYGIVKGVMPMAAALAGGISMAVMTARGLTDSLDKGRRGAQQTAKAGLALGKGAYGLGKGAYGLGKAGVNKLRGNSVSNAGGGGWQPAYNAATLGNLQRKSP
ncbi:type IV secretion system protein [Thauera sp.]